MAIVKTTKPVTLTGMEMHQLHNRVGNIRCAVELALEASCNSGGANEEIGRAIGVLAMVARELQSVEGMLEPVILKRIRAQQLVEVAHG